MNVLGIFREGVFVIKVFLFVFGFCFVIVILFYFFLVGRIVFV